MNANQFLSHQCGAKTLSRPQDMTGILSTYGRTTFSILWNPCSILIQKLCRIYFHLEDKIGRLDSSVAVGVALGPGERESQGGGARRAPARQVALGQEVDG